MAILKSRANRHENSNHKDILCFQVQSSWAMTHIFHTISWLLNYVIPSDTEFPLGRCLPADPTAGDILQVRLPVPSTGLHCLHQNHRLKTWWSRRCRGLIGFLCVRGSGVLPIPAGGKGGAFHLVVCEIKERGKFFVRKLRDLPYSFYIWFSGTERSEERPLKWIGNFRWLFEPRKPRIK